MPVYIENPISFELEEFLLNTLINGQKLSLVDPETGLEINSVLANLPAIGLTFQPTPDHRNPMGFLPEANPGKSNVFDDPLKPQFEPEAILIFDSGDIPLPEKIKNAEVWVIQVKNQENEDLYAEVAKKICDKYQTVNIVVTSAFKTIGDKLLPEEAKLKFKSSHPIGIAHVSDPFTPPSS